MSTAGKVLSIVCCVMLLVWVTLMAGVAQLNMNYGKKLQDQLKEVANLKADLEKTNLEIRTLKTAVFNNRRLHDENTRVLAARMAGTQRQFSTTVEALSRLQIQVNDYLKAVEEAKQSVAYRTEEKDETTKKLADTRAAVERDKAANEELKGQLQKLQEDFVRTLEANTRATQALLKGGAVARPASLSRPAR